MTPLFVSYTATRPWETIKGHAVVGFEHPVSTWDDILEVQRCLRTYDGVPSNAVITNWRRMEDPA